MKRKKEERIALTLVTLYSAYHTIQDCAHRWDRVDRIVCGNPSFDLHIDASLPCWGASILQCSGAVRAPVMITVMTFLCICGVPLLEPLPGTPGKSCVLPAGSRKVLSTSAYSLQGFLL